jgi:hypothetical protein
MNAEEWDNTDHVARMFEAINKPRTWFDGSQADFHNRYLFCEIFHLDIAAHDPIHWPELQSQLSILQKTIYDEYPEDVWFQNSIMPDIEPDEQVDQKLQSRPRSIAEHAWVMELPPEERPTPQLFERLFTYDVTIPDVIRQLLEPRPYNARLAHRFRCLHLNPFSKIYFRREWKTDHVRGLVHGICEEHAYDRLMILADALEEAGCTDQRILQHCREPYCHSERCLVLQHLGMLT